MNRKAFGVFEKICAEEDLKQKTTSYLREEIEKRARRKKFLWLRRAISFACLAVLFLCGGLFYREYMTPVAYIDFDVNPSVEFRINRFGRVITSHAYNDDGDGILAYVNVNYLSYSEAVKRLLDAMGEEGYLGQDALLCVTVQTNEPSRENLMIQSLKEIVGENKRDGGYDILADIYAVTEEVKHCAAEFELSPAKYLAIEGLIEVDPEADFEICRNHSVHELREMAREKCKEEKDHYGMLEPTEEEIDSDRNEQEEKDISAEPREEQEDTDLPSDHDSHEHGHGSGHHHGN
ncbi:MAG: hypothetical protein K2O71_05105 [Lachnospiraceae bacterium]|nr:hypothetical protein [Lachnospiraceae bacterium]